MTIKISICATHDGWFLTDDTVRNQVIFRSGAEAERAARALLQSYSDAGKPAELHVYLRDGSLAGHYVAAFNGSKQERSVSAAEVGQQIPAA